MVFLLWFQKIKMRCFVSINIPKKVQNEIKKIQGKLPKFFGKKTKLENLHLTLKFFGEVEENKIEEIKKKLKEIKFGKFEVRVEELGVFSEQFIRIVWLHLKNCGKLQRAIDEKMFELSFEKEKRFMGHLTIARVKNVKNKKEFLEGLKKIKVPEIKFNVDKFYLMKSILSAKSPEYKIIEEFGLL